jgi:TetR/AcrR family transcriptional regulator, transcriptional repressor for nem operon
MMPRKLEFDRQAAVVAATHTFWERGYAATSLDDLTERLGIGRASLYNAFGDKRQLLLEALDAYSDTARGMLAEALASSASGRESLAQLLLYHTNCEGQAANGCLCVNMGIELSDVDAEVRRAVLANIARMEDTFYALIQRGISDGSVRAHTPAREAARAVLACVIGVQSMKRMGVSQAIISASINAQISML